MFDSAEKKEKLLGIYEKEMEALGIDEIHRKSMLVYLTDFSLHNDLKDFYKELNNLRLSLGLQL